MTVELTYRALGDDRHGCPLIVLHGLLGSAGNWRPLARKLADTRPVYCLDLRNHGQSPHAEQMDYPRMAADVHEFMKTKRIPVADVLGHSMGGKVAMALALEQPAVVSRLIVVDIAPVNYPQIRMPMVEAMRQLPFDQVIDRADADALMQPCIADDQLRSFLLTNLVRQDSGFAWRVYLDVIVQSMPELAAFPDYGDRQFAGAALFLGGAESEYRIDQASDAIRARFPAAHLEMITGAGHWPHADQPEATLAVIDRFLGGAA